MEFAAWREWSASEVAFFVSTFCELPQYATAIGQNISGQALQRLLAANMLAKGLARAGVCDWNHQQLIATAVEKLQSLSSEELSEELNLRLRESVKWRHHRNRRPSPPNTARGNRPRRRQVEVDLRLWDLEAMNSARSKTPTAAGMQRPSTADAQIDSSSRPTPRPWNDNSGEGRTQPDDGFENSWPSMGGTGFLASQRLREHLATNLREYETMRQAREPLYATISPRIPRAPESCRPQTTSAPTQCMSEMRADFTKSRGNTAPARNSNSSQLSSTRNEMPKASSLTGAESLFKHDVPSFTIGGAITSQESNDMMQGLLTMHGKDESAVGGGLRGVQKIQEQRHHQKEEKSHSHEYGIGTLETLTGVLGPTIGSGEDPLSPNPSGLSAKSSPDKRQGELVTSQASDTVHDEDRAITKTREEVKASDTVHDEAMTHPHSHSPSRHSTNKSSRQGEVATHRPSSGGDMHDEEQRAALKVQSFHRQRQAMREAELRRHNKKEAAIKTSQEHHTAEQAQHYVQRKKEESEKKIFDEQMLAATKIQAIHRGNKARNVYYEKHHHKDHGTPDPPKGQHSPSKRKASMSEETASLGQHSPSKRKSSMSEETAATSIQATFRGNRDRKSSVQSNRSNSSRGAHHRSSIGSDRSK